MTKTLTIKSEEDALNLLETLKEEELMEAPVICFQGWPSLEILISGSEYNSSLKSSQLRALVKLQDSIYYQYGLINNKQYKNLTNEEREQLELKVTVRKGSSDILVELTKVFNNLLANGIPSTNIITGIVLLSAIYGSIKVASRYFDVKSKEIEADNRHLELIEKLALQNQMFANLVVSASHVLDNISRSATDSDELLINKSPTSQIRHLKKPRKSKEKSSSAFTPGKNYELKCTVVAIKDEGKGGYECRFKDSESEEILVWKQKKNEISPTLDHELRNAFNSKKQISITMQITKTLRSGGEISISKILGQKPRSFKNGRHNKRIQPTRKPRG